ncbi:MAG: hypothetical protein ACXV2E_08740 [Halobacteriota archaeon]
METIRRLRYGALVRLFRDRYGHQLPDDDAGREDLWLLVTNVSLAAAEPQKKMRHVIDVWAPWMSAAKCEAYVTRVWGLDIYERTRTARELGEQLRMTNGERERLKLWPFKPIDATDEEIAERRKARRNERRRTKRGRTRAEYLANCMTRKRPWEAEGISRRTWERRRVASVGPTIVTKAETILATASMVETQKGFQGGAVAKPDEAMKARDVERTESGSSGLCHNLRHEQPLQIQLPDDPRIQALARWESASTKKPWSKPAILSDEPRDFAEFPLNDELAA